MSCCLVNSSNSSCHNCCQISPQRVNLGRTPFPLPGYVANISVHTKTITTMIHHEDMLLPQHWHSQHRKFLYSSSCSFLSCTFTHITPLFEKWCGKNKWFDFWRLYSPQLKRSLWHFGLQIKAVKPRRWFPVSQRIAFQISPLVYKVLIGIRPEYISVLLLLYEASRPLRSCGTGLHSVPRIKTKQGEAAPHLWKKLPDTVS